MKKIIEWLKVHWHERIFKIGTAGGLILVYMEIFHRPELNALLTNPVVIGAVASLLIGKKI